MECVVRSFPPGPDDLLRLWHEVDRELAHRDLIARHRARVRELAGLVATAEDRGARWTEIEGLLRDLQSEAEGLRGIVLATQRNPWRR